MFKRDHERELKEVDVLTSILAELAALTDTLKESREDAIHNEVKRQISEISFRFAQTFPPLYEKEIFPGSSFKGVPVLLEEYIKHYDEYVDRCHK